MRIILLLSILAAGAFAQELQRITIDKAPGIEAGAMTMSLTTMGVAGEMVKGAPYSATIITETTQTLADGNRIVQKNQGSIARDSMGRTRNESPLPLIGNMAAKNMPAMIFINDPSNGVHYTLNPIDKSFRKITEPSSPQEAKFRAERRSGTAGPEQNFVFERKVLAESTTVAVRDGSFRIAAPIASAASDERMYTAKLDAERAVKTESLGSKLIDGVMAEGTRSTRTIAAGEIGNVQPIDIVSEMWFSPELKTIVYSRRSDPRSGETAYSLTNISRSEPDPSLFAPPADFTEAVGNPMRGTVIYRPKD